MPKALLRYGLVAHGTSVLCEHRTRGLESTSFSDVARHMLEKARADAAADGGKAQERQSIKMDRYMFHFLVRGDTAFMCMADVGFGEAAPFALLEKLARLYVESLGEPALRTAPHALDLDGLFAPLLHREMELFAAAASGQADQAHGQAPGVQGGDGGGGGGGGAGADRLREVRGDLDRVAGAMQENISLVMDRGDKLDSLHVQSEGLVQSSTSFRSGATQLQRQMQWNTVKMRLTLAGCAVVVVYVLAVGGCGGATLPDCHP